MFAKNTILTCKVALVRQFQGEETSVIGDELPHRLCCVIAEYGFRPSCSLRSVITKNIP